VQILGGLQGPVAFPNQTAAGTATWVTENPGSDVADSNLLLSQITLNAEVAHELHELLAGSCSRSR
jgi:hypothetical protein